MQFRSALLAFLVLLTPSPLSSSSLLAGAFDGGDHDQQQPIVDNTAGLKVPGDNPLRFCSSPVDNVMQIDYVDISPNPPKPYVCFIPLFFFFFSLVVWAGGGILFWFILFARLLACYLYFSINTC